VTAETPEFPPELLNYFAVRQQERDDRANTAWRTLTNFERRVLKESAVMAYVVGYLAGNADGRQGNGGPFDNIRRIPADHLIVRTVLQHCDSTSDLYPFLGEACEGRRRRITAARRWPGEETTR
jgi:hypothetical protein